MVSKDIEIDLAVYPLAAVHKAAAALSDRCAVKLANRSPAHVVATLTPLVPSGTVESLENAFLLSLTDHAVQESINQQTQGIRLALVRAALAEALKTPPSTTP